MQINIGNGRAERITVQQVLGGTLAILLPARPGVRSQQDRLLVPLPARLSVGTVEGGAAIIATGPAGEVHVRIDHGEVSEVQDAIRKASRGRHRSVFANLAIGASVLMSGAALAVHLLWAMSPVPNSALAARIVREDMGRMARSDGTEGRPPSAVGLLQSMTKPEDTAALLETLSPEVRKALKDKNLDGNPVAVAAAAAQFQRFRERMVAAGAGDTPPVTGATQGPPPGLFPQSGAPPAPPPGLFGGSASPQQAPPADLFPTGR